MILPLKGGTSQVLGSAGTTSKCDASRYGNLPGAEPCIEYNRL